MGKTTRRAWMLAALGLPLGCTWPFTANSPMRLPPAGEDAPPADGIDADGKPVGLSAHRGKVVLLTFWFSTCPPCRRMFPHENALYAKFGNAPFAVVGVCSDPDPGQMRQTQYKHGHQFPSIWDGPQGKVCSAWAIKGFPTLALIDQWGKVRYRNTGETAPATLEAAIRQLLAEGAPAKAA
jgi:thiol-disulfide isomerase/thioredoxin